MSLRHYILSFLLILSGRLFAQDVKFTASASQTQVGTGEQFEITFSLNGNGQYFSPPNLNNFQVVGGPNVSTSMESVNGNTTISNAYSYELVAVKEGDYTIAPASIVVNGRKISSNSIKIKVVKGRPVQQSNRGQNGPDNSVTEAKPGNLAKSLFLRTVLDKDNVYQGQQLTLTYRLYTRVGIVQSQLDKLPDLTGFWNEEIKTQQQQVAWHTEVYKGVKYNVADVKQIILFPEHSGSIKIDPFEMSFIVRVAQQSGDVFDQLFGGSFQDLKYSAKSLPVTIHVKPLPETGKPDSFSGAVGNFTIASSVDKTELKANEALNYKVKISGSGNIKLLKNLNTNFPPDFEKYDPKVTDSVTESESGVAGTRFYNYLLIPRHEGNFTIEPFKFSYFNPSTGRYISLATKPFPIKVNKGTAESNVTAFSDAGKQDVKLLDKDIRFIKTGDPDLHRQGSEFYGSAGYYVLLLVGPLLCLLAFNYRNWQQKNNSDIVKVKSRRAGKVAAKHLASAQKELIAGNKNEFYEAIFRGLYGYLSDKLNIAYADLNRDKISAALKARSLNEGLITRLLDTLDLCEMARYAPVRHISEQQVFDKSKGIINDIENET